MRSPAVILLYVAVMVAIIVGVDFAFLRGDLWARLIVNIGIVLAFAAVYLSLLRHR